MVTRNRAAVRTEADPSRPLSDVVAALTGEFARASVARDAFAAELSRVYGKSPLLSEFSASRVRVVSARLSFPVAMDGVAATPVRDVGLTTSDLIDALPSGLDKRTRQKLSQQIVEELDRNGKNSWTNAGLLDSVLGQLRQHGIEAGDSTGQFRVSRLAALQQAFQAQQPVAHAVRVLYRAADLEKLPPERLVRIDLELAVD